MLRQELVRSPGLAPALATSGRELQFSSPHVVGIGLTGRSPAALEGKCWMYFPEGDCPFYRVTVFSHYSPNNVPDIRQYWSLMAEVSESPVKAVSASRVVDETIAGMLATGLVADRRQVHHAWYRKLEHGYPTPSCDRDRALSVIQPALERREVYSRGRFGAWKYEVSNQDHSFAQGVECVDRLLHLADEETVNHPAVVNARRSTPRGAAVERGAR